MTGNVSRNSLINKIQKDIDEFKNITRSTQKIKSSHEALEQLDKLNELQESTKKDMNDLSGRGINFKIFQRSKTKNTNEALQQAQSTLEGIELIKQRILQKYAEMIETEEKTLRETPMNNTRNNLQPIIEEIKSLQSKLEEINSKMESPHTEIEDQALNISKEKLEAQISHLKSAHKNLIRDCEGSSEKLTIFEVEKNAKEESIEHNTKAKELIEKENTVLEKKVKALSSELNTLIEKYKPLPKTETLKKDIIALEEKQQHETNSLNLRKIKQDLEEKKNTYRTVVELGESIQNKKIELAETTKQFASKQGKIIELSRKINNDQKEIELINKEITNHINTIRALSQDKKALNKLKSKIENKSNVELLKTQHTKTNELDILNNSIASHEKEIPILEQAIKELEVKIQEEGTKKSSPIFQTLVSTYDEISKKIQSEKQALESEKAAVPKLEKEIVELKNSIEQEQTQNMENQNLLITTLEDLNEINRVNHKSIIEAKIEGERKELELVNHYLDEERGKLRQLRKDIDKLNKNRNRAERLRDNVLINERPTKENKHRIENEIENLQKIVDENKVIATLGKKPSAKDREKHKLATEALNKISRLKATLKLFAEYEELSKNSSNTLEQELNQQIIALEKSIQAKEQKMSDIKENIAALAEQLA